MGTVVTAPLIAALQRAELDAATDVLANATEEGRLYAAGLYVRQGSDVFAKSFGASKSSEDIFLLASISKPISAAALMTLYDQGEFRLDDPVQKFIPEFREGSKRKITVQQLLTHVSGLPDQLPENQALRQRQARLSEFVDRAHCCSNRGRSTDTRAWESSWRRR